MTTWQNRPSSLQDLLPSQSLSSLSRALCQSCQEQLPLLFLFAHVGFIPCQAFDDMQQVQLCPPFLPEHGPLLLAELKENSPTHSRPSLLLIQSSKFVNTLDLAWSYCASSPPPWRSVLSFICPYTPHSRKPDLSPIPLMVLPFLQFALMLFWWYFYNKYMGRRKVCNI